MESRWIAVGCLALTVALAGCGGGSSGDDGDDGTPVTPTEPTTPGGGDPPTGSATQAPLAKPFAFATARTDEALMRAMAGEYVVAITAAPKAADIGVGKLVVRYGGSDGAVAIELRNADGKLLSRLTSPALSDRSAADGRGINLWDTAVEAGFRPAFSDGSLAGRRIGIYNYYDAGNTNGPEAYALVSFVGPGYVAGSAGAYRFRNSVQYAGTAAPSAFATLRGRYRAAAEALTCSPNPIDITVSARTVRVKGKSSVSCEAQDVEVAWDGQDDFIFTDAAGKVSLVLDERNGGGSQPGGGIFVTLPEAGKPETFGPLTVNFAGAAGGITAVDPVKR